VPGTKTNERPGTRAVLRHCHMSAWKARQVLDLIRGVEYARAIDILRFCDREAADVIGKLLHSAAANAEHNDSLASDDLYVSACFADEGTTAKRWRPRARGRVTRIRKRTCHITVIVSRLPEDELRRKRAKVAAEAADRRARRVAGARRTRRSGEGVAPASEAATEASATSGDETPSSADASLADDLLDDGAFDDDEGEMEDGADDATSSLEEGVPEAPEGSDGAGDADDIAANDPEESK
jgi:large subunit ribosomal protein L22